jgi:hypothetical protein
VSATFSQPSIARPGEPLRPIAVLGLEPAELEQHGVHFHPTPDDGLDTAQAGLVELADGRQFGLVRYDHAPVSGTELLATESSIDVERDLRDLLHALGLSDTAVTWRLDPAEVEQRTSEAAEPPVSRATLQRVRDLAERLREHPAAERLVLAPRHGVLGLSHAQATGARPTIEVGDDVTRVLVYVEDDVLEAEVAQAHPAFHVDEFGNALVVELLVDGVVTATATVELAVSPIGALGGRAKFLNGGELVAGPKQFDVVVRPGEPDL